MFWVDSDEYNSAADNRRKLARSCSSTVFVRERHAHEQSYLGTPNLYESIAHDASK